MTGLSWLEGVCLCAVIAVPVVALAGCEASVVNPVIVGNSAAASEIPPEIFQIPESSRRFLSFAAALTDAAAVAMSRG